MSMDEARAAADREAIRDVLHRYCRYLDERNLDALVEEVYAADATDDRRRGAPKVGRAEIRAYMARARDLCEATAHLLSNIEIELDGDSARARSRVMACHWFAETSYLGKARASECVLVGTYDDRLARLPEGWRIVHRQVGALGPAGLLAGTLPPAFRGFAGVEL